MALTSRQVSAIRHRHREREFERLERDEARRQNTIALADPDAEYDRVRSDVTAYMGRDCRTYCARRRCVTAAGFTPSVPTQVARDVRCAACGRPVGEARR